MIAGVPPDALGEPDPDLVEWLALRRVHRGGVARFAGRYLDHGCPMPGYLTDALDGLIRAGLLALGSAD